MIGDFLPGELVIEKGSARDYESLARFHYVGGRPGTWAAVWVARYREQSARSQAEVKNLKAEKNANRTGEGASITDFRIQTSAFSDRVVAIAVLSWSPLGCRPRDSVLNLRRFPMKERASWINQNLRTISRVVVHPQFRGVGLGSELVRRILREAPTRYVETIAAMGKVHPFFEKAGMRRIQHDGEKAYFIFDRKKCN